LFALCRLLPALHFRFSAKALRLAALRRSAMRRRYAFDRLFAKPVKFFFFFGQSF
jgi:hypothetical protein